MKITFVTATLSSGGSERVMTLIANALVDRGHEVSIILLRDKIVFYNVDERVQLIYANDASSHLYAKITWLRRYIKNSKPDVVIPFMTAVYCTTILSLLNLKVPIISSERIDPRHSSRLRKLLRWIFLRYTTHLVVQTSDIKSYYSKSIQRRTSIIANPVSDTVFNLTADVEPISRIITVGRLHPQKNHHMLIDAFSEVAKRYPKYSLVIYGEGPLRHELTEHIERLHLENKVLLAGRTDKIIEELQKSEIFCLSSDFEGMSNALIEAQCVGLPIVTTNVSGVNDIMVNGIHGYITPTKDKKLFAESIIRVIEDKDASREFSKNNKQAAQRYRLESIVTEWEELITQIVKNNA